jgi:hypothetical protein
MNLKETITQNVLSIIDPNYTEKSYQTALAAWWANTRKKSSGGLKLTKEGFDVFCQAEIKYYPIQFEHGVDIPMTNRLIIWLDHYIECPFYLTKKEICVFNERMAVQLVLFSGNIYKFGLAKSNSR